MSKKIFDFENKILLNKILLGNDTKSTKLFTEILVGKIQSLIIIINLKNLKKLNKLKLISSVI